LAKRWGQVDFVSIFLEKAALLAAWHASARQSFHPRRLRVVIATHSAISDLMWLLLYARFCQGPIRRIALDVLNLQDEVLNFRKGSN
jgi:hypothetical protein